MSVVLVWIVRCMCVIPSSRFGSTVSCSADWLLPVNSVSVYLAVCVVVILSSMVICVCVLCTIVGVR